MMKLSELYQFMLRHYKSDTKLGFACRMARFGILAMPLLVAESKMRSLRRNGYKYIVESVWGNDMLLNPHDTGIGTDLLLCGKREPLICTKFRELLKEGMAVYDIGANIGYYALQEAQLVGESGRVYAIEPVPESKRILEMNIAVNGYKNIDVYRLAMGDKEGVGQINLNAMSNMATMTEEIGYRNYDNAVSVKVDTVDNFMVGKRPPDVVRMDTEGYEVKIVEGMEGLLAIGRPLILFIEIHFDALKEKVIPMLKSLKEYGFEVKYAAFETHPIVQDSWLLPLVNLCEKGMGASGYANVKIDDLINNRCFISGQVENLEVIFERVG